jgi:uncharacterized protein YdiU (UPF0061 family)
MADNAFTMPDTSAPPTHPPAPQPATHPATTLRWPNRFARLPSVFHTRLSPTPLPDPYWVGRNPALAQALGLAPGWLETDEALQALTGNAVLPGSEPLASVYSGHQFGVWAGQLGDGRAILLGEIDTADGPREVQLKGAGPTPYSRRADGRAVLRSSIREFLCSEAMHGLGIPTTRALCVSGSDARVRREEIETAAVVTRVAPSFVRFGHFEHFSSNGLHDALRTLADHVIDGHYPECRHTTRFDGNPYAALLEAVSERTARMVAQWQAVGFCHGVMNTDNMSILGLTIDYGPFQFMDAYDPGHICNHSDTQGRYAFGRQPNIAYWNLFCLGQALLPLISPDGDQARALAALESYKTVFPAEFEARMAAKLGLVDAPAPGDRALIESTLQLLARNQVDYTIFWRRLSLHVAAQPAHSAQAAQATHSAQAAQALRDLFIDRAAFEAWLLQYSERMSHTPQGLATDLMLKTNPKYVLRNHLGELAIRAARQMDFSHVQTLLTVLESPFDEHPQFDALAGFPPEWAGSIAISCSS